MFHYLSQTGSGNLLLFLPFVTSSFEFESNTKDGHPMLLLADIDIEDIVDTPESEQLEDSILLRLQCIC